MTRGVAGLTVVFLASLAALLFGLATGGGVIDPQARPAAAVVTSSEAGHGSFADIVDRVDPSVVHITVVDPVGRPEDDEDDPQDGPPERGPHRGEGSGFVVDPRGEILTNHHLVDGATRIRVRFTDKREFPAEVIGADPSTDLALLRVQASGLKPVPLGDSDHLRVGDWVCAIGNPYSFDHSVTVGVVSSKGRKIWDASFDAYIQTDAAINPGNSGGPLLNAEGEAVGINAAVSTEGQGIGFAIPINVARDILGQLRASGHVSRGYLGVQLQEMDPDLQKLVGLKEGHGAVVLDILKGSAGEAAGLRRYDVITEVSGLPIQDGDQLVHAISAHSPGSTVALKVVRDGREVSLDARLTERGAEAQQRTNTVPAEDVTREGDALGLIVNDLGRKMRNELRIPPDRAGVVVRDVVGLSPGIDPLTHGDIVVEVNRRATPDVATYKRVLGTLKPGDIAWLFVYRPRPVGTFLAKVEVESR
jgi:serine protease Do